MECYSFLTKSAKIKLTLRIEHILWSYSFLTKSAKIKHQQGDKAQS